MLETIISDYKDLLEELDQKCDQTQKGLPMIPCPDQCYDCCKQIFPVSFLEAYYLSRGFHSLERKKRRELSRLAQKALKKMSQINAEDFTVFNKSWEEIMQKRKNFSDTLNSIKTNCPFLDESGNGGKCSVYKERNHDCRAHGYSYDGLTREIIACFRFPEIFPTPKKFIEKAFDYNYRYQDKLKLDQKLIVYLTKNPLLKSTIYLTHPFVALLKNFEEIDWINFFKNKVTEKQEKDKFSLIIDTEL